MSSRNKEVTIDIACFLLLSILVIVNPNWLQSLDSRLTVFINSYRINGLDATVNFASNLATPILILVIVIAFILYLRTKNKIQLNASLFLLKSFATSATLTFIIKNLVRRERPFIINHEIVKLGSGGSFSFPSGHTADAFILLFAIPLAFPTNKILRHLSVSWALFIAYSRMYLGVHFITDILASIILAKISVYIFSPKISQ